jgi:hypothetical protein
MTAKIGGSIGCRLLLRNRFPTLAAIKGLRQTSFAVALIRS